MELAWLLACEEAVVSERVQRFRLVATLTLLLSYSRMRLLHALLPEPRRIAGQTINDVRTPGSFTTYSFFPFFLLATIETHHGGTTKGKSVREHGPGRNGSFLCSQLHSPASFIVFVVLSLLRFLLFSSSGLAGLYVPFLLPFLWCSKLDWIDSVGTECTISGSPLTLILLLFSSNCLLSLTHIYDY